MASKRRPYVREIHQNWWQKNPFYRLYMLREGTSVLAVWVSLLLLYGLMNPVTYIEILSNPLVMLINLLAFVASIFHTKTWFDVAPKAINLKDAQVAKLKTGLWTVTIVSSIIILIIAFMA